MQSKGTKMTSDIGMNERTKKTVRVNVTNEAGEPYDITAATEIEWVAYQGSILRIRKTLGIMTITKGNPGVGGITYFTFPLYPADTVLPVTKTVGTPVVWVHEARITFPATLFGAAEYVSIAGKMYIMPSITGVSV
jgi:hypothetical protein